MTSRGHVHDLVRQIRRYLAWQKSQGVGHYVPASGEEREEFEAKKEARRKEELAELRSRFADEKDGESESASPRQSSSPQPASSPSPETGDPKKQTPDSGESSSASTETDTESQEGFEVRKAFENEIADNDSGGDEDFDPVDTSGSAGDEAEVGEVSSSTPLWKRHDSIRELTGREQEQQESASGGGNSQSQGGRRRDQRSGGGRADERRGDPRSGGRRADERRGDPRSGRRRAEERRTDGTGDSQQRPSSPAEKMEYLREYLGDCTRCPLHENRSNIVFGDGDPEARLMFIGEGPGRHEDDQGLPFVGKSGQLLTKMIEAMGLDRQKVYITNVVKCRPPGNRNPAPLEIKECAPFLKKQIQVVEPAVIVTLGKFASNTILEKDDALGRLRGRWHEHMGVPVMPTYHPAYLLRNEGDRKFKQRSWNDLQMVIERLGL